MNPEIQTSLDLDSALLSICVKQNMQSAFSKENSLEITMLSKLQIQDELPNITETIFIENPDKWRIEAFKRAKEKITVPQRALALMISSAIGSTPCALNVTAPVLSRPSQQIHSSIRFCQTRLSNI